MRGVARLSDCDTSAGCALGVVDLGRAPYASTLDLQRRLVEAVKSSNEELGFLVLVEHDPPVITLGRSGKEEHVLLSREELARSGFEIFETTRGGDVTYHGPGQIVGYPILRVDLHGRDAHLYLRDIEEVLMRTVARFDLEGRRVKGMTGVWVGDEKIAATGVAISRWVSYHGFALNVSTDLSHFRTIVPCGIVGKGVTSLSAMLGRTVDVEEVKPVLVECLVEVLGFSGTREIPSHLMV
ncbi:lipoyl(octanoyl) transferase LipB [Candidatus Sumerlaeota bacterium]|nr:lipoyl(octanoyl) transferase LipB [Candidatus Sumerlaeota bacterium]